MQNVKERKTVERVLFCSGGYTIGKEDVRTISTNSKDRSERLHDCVFTYLSARHYSFYRHDFSPVQQVRRRMKDEGIDAFIIPTEDPHMSEYVAPYFGRREFVR